MSTLWTAFADWLTRSEWHAVFAGLMLAAVAIGIISWLGMRS